MDATLLNTERRTTTDEVFERLHADIVTLRLEPGTKVSEVEVSRQFAVSRQPVREAFIRLASINLLQIRPQKATVVKKISLTDSLNARFIRTAVEVDVVRTACVVAKGNDIKLLRINLQDQKQAANKRDATLFHELDYDFHRLLCIAANCEFAFATISQNKAHVDRLCMLSLASRDGMLELYDDHANIVEALENRDEDSLVARTRQHLSRLDGTLARARARFPDFFED